MPSTARDRLVFAVCLCTACVPVFARQQTPLTCESNAAESAVLGQAPEGAHRKTKHVLEVKTKKGIRRFVDRPPHAEGEMGGVHWQYCGFDQKSGAHLISRVDEDGYTGNVLLNDRGSLLPGGYKVLFSPTAREYLAIRQVAGEDGEEWTVYDIAGKTIWKSYAGTITHADGVDMVVSTFADPQWTGEGELTAQYTCAASKHRGLVKLIHAHAAMHGWANAVKCS